MKSIGILNKKINKTLLVIWFINDSYLKYKFPGNISGKISDIIGVYLSPFIICGILTFIFRDIKEKYLFLFSLLTVLIYFLSINISQEINDQLHNLLFHNKINKGVSDPSDLFCLFMLFFSYKAYTKGKVYLAHFSKKLFVLSFSFIVFIHSPPIDNPSGRPDVLSYLFAISAAEEAIYLIAPTVGEKIKSDYIFKFRYVGKDNESTPYSIDTLVKPSTCEDITSEAYQNERNDLNRKFVSYIIEISKDKDFSNSNTLYICETQECNLDLNSLNNDFYFWRVQLKYENIKDCEVNEKILVPRQEAGYFEY